MNERKDKCGDYEVIGSDYTMQHLFLIAVPEAIPSDPKGRPKAEALTSRNQFTIGKLVKPLVNHQRSRPASRLVA